MKSAIGCAALVALVTSSAFAQQPGVQVQPAPTEAPAAVQPDIVLPLGTEVILAMATEINSTANDTGDTFPLTTVSDIRVGDQIVIPRGTRAIGEITWRTGRGAFGKSGKMDVALRYIDLDGQRIPIQGTFRQEGNGATVATIAGVIAAGVFAGFITGHRATIPAGRELVSHTAYAVPFTASGHLSRSYDAAAALAAARTDPAADHGRRHH